MCSLEPFLYLMKTTTRGINIIKMLRIILLIVASVGYCGDSYTSLGPYQLGSTLTQVQGVGYPIKLSEPANKFKTDVYETKIDGTTMSLIFSDGLLHSIIIKLERSSYAEYLKGKQDFIGLFGRRPNVSENPGVIPQYITVWWHDVGTTFSLNYDPKTYTTYMSLTIR